ncbi:hypothetical protein EYF80_012949 [Liparis tanakae]|uniref:Uncharacterized protein n=1 Tax=Liparis tanakae TaxID=230148 RepID=A0A4Z2IFY3_9TELE|nr:hypothetical protein EYF80_012949 [Liparis tanakae]
MGRTLLGRDARDQRGLTGTRHGGVRRTGTLGRSAPGHGDIFNTGDGLTGSQKPYCENQWPRKPVSREEATRWDGLRRADRGEREAPLRKQGSA